MFPVEGCLSPGLVCVCAFVWLEQRGKQFFGKSVVSEGFEGLKSLEKCQSQEWLGRDEFDVDGSHTWYQEIQN